MKGELIFGVNPVKESLQGTRGAFNLYVQVSATDHRVEKIIKLAEERGVAVHRREKLDLTKMCAIVPSPGDRTGGGTVPLC